MEVQFDVITAAIHSLRKVHLSDYSYGLLSVAKLVLIQEMKHILAYYFVYKRIFDLLLSSQNLSLNYQDFC